jgi:hypothetical protein
MGDKTLLFKEAVTFLHCIFVVRSITTSGAMGGMIMTGNNRSAGKNARPIAERI